MLKLQFCTAVILTTLPITYRAIRSHLNTVYERGSFTAEGRIWDIGIVEVDIGNANAALEAERAISYFKPNLILFVGVAGGIKDVRIGDVVAATKVYGYHSGKAKAEFEARPDVGWSDHGLVQRARAVRSSGRWTRRIPGGSPDPAPAAYVEPI